MYFDSLAEFVAMGRHGAYVWSAYGFTLLVFAANIAAATQLRRRALRAVALEMQLARGSAREKN